MKSIKMATIAVLSALALTACDVSTSNDSRATGQKEQENIMQRAVNSDPTYQPSNFLTREAVNEWMRRMDVPDKTFYVYLLGDNGNHIGYYVAQTRPICSSARLTPPDRIRERNASGGGNYAVTTQAPALDGVYYAGQCDSYFFFDATTDAFIEISNRIDFFTTDQPLKVDADPINVQTD